MKFFNSLSLLTALASTAFAVVVPGADTPLFYLVSTSKDTAPNLLVCSFLPSEGKRDMLTSFDSRCA